MHKNIDLLVLDYGGVYSFEWTASNFNKIMNEVFGKIPSDQEREKISVQSHLLGANKINSTEYVSRVSEILECPAIPEVAVFEEVTISVTNPPSPVLVDMVTRLRRTGLNISLLSDMYMFEIIKTKPMGRYDDFDYVSLSAEVGLTKNTPAVFEATLDYFNCQPDRALFVDDTHANIEVAASAGLQTLWVDKNQFSFPVDLQKAIEDRL